MPDNSPTLLGIEIGGTKLQAALGRADGSPLIRVLRRSVVPAHGAQGILGQLESMVGDLLAQQPCAAMGVGFGGPCDVQTGTVLRSHHVRGWENFALADWCRQRFGIAARVANDADTAGLAEAQHGAGRGANPVLYVTVGSGIGGGLVVDGAIYRGAGYAAIEIGHLRPGLAATGPEQTVEQLASGWGIAQQARARVEQLCSALNEETAATFDDVVDEDQVDGPVTPRPRHSGGDPLVSIAQQRSAQLTAADVFSAAAAGSELARETVHEAIETLGWALGQAVTLLAPEVIVLGGGVSLVGEEQFLAPLRQVVARYAFPPLAQSYRLVPAALGEEVVLHGALALAAQCQPG